MISRIYLVILLIGICSTDLHAEISSDLIPNLGNSSSGLISIEQEKALGKAWLRKLKKHVKTYNNPIVTEYLTNLVYKLAPNSGVIDRDFTITIIDNPTLNAFAVPGSIIGINSGLFFNAASEQEFASVIAHELAHLSQRHYARMLEQQKRSSPVELAGFLASVLIAVSAGSEAGMAALASTQALSADRQLRFSRKNEQEADRLAIQVMADSGFNPRAMPLMFSRMHKQTRLRSESLPEYLSTHPLSETRISDTKGRAEQFPRTKYNDDIEYYFCKSIIITDYSESAHAAIEYFNNKLTRGSSQQKDISKFGLAYAYLNVNPLKSQELLEELLAKYPNQISINIIYAKALSNSEKHHQSSKTLESQLNRNPNNYSISKALAESYLNADKIQRAKQLLVQLSKQHPEDHQTWYLLAEVAGLAGDITLLHESRAEYFFLTGRITRAIEQLGLAIQKNDKELNEVRIHNRLKYFYEIKRNPLI